jgi:S1-C subfamily serine protease
MPDGQDTHQREASGSLVDDPASSAQEEPVAPQADAPAPSDESGTLPYEPHAEMTAGLESEAALDETLPDEEDVGAIARAESDPWFWDMQSSNRPRRPVLRAALAWFIAALLGAGVGAGTAYVVLDDKATGSVNVVEPPVDAVTGLPENKPALVARAVLPSIVRVDVTGFGSGGVGSGVIYRNDGYIVTNNHVVRGADSVEVRLGGEVLPAAVVGTAAPTVDIAVLKVAKSGLPAATFGSTKTIEVGDLAVAIGSPFGLDATVTAGVISGLHRNGSVEGVTDAIQTDAPINPGNSGGALANARGEVIGINTAIVGTTGGNVGVGFAIPVEIVRKVADQIIERGKAQLAFLGIQGSNLPGGEGAVVVSVVNNGPADRAGIRRDDVILSVDGATVASMDALITLLIEKNVGDEVAIEIRRDGRTRTVHATLAARPEG